ncbi:MAG: carbon-nitrogen hydrolase family protein [Gammaproteobacteria bacterium]|nr:carbon-nitrogen hydrolase family protein [Gammaproteobacteria bacterium]
MSESFIAACVQNCAGPDMTESIEQAAELTKDAADQGADLICLPEFFSCLSKDEKGLHVQPHGENDHPALAQLTTMAWDLDKWILLGSLAINDGVNTRNRSYLINNTGEITTRYDKIHMFDVNLANGEVYKESDLFKPGETAVIAHTPWAKLGMTVCYDLRFAYLYRTLAQAGASILTCPAAFTKTTGEAHWHTLLRARAIETGSYVIAPCQNGSHGDAKTYGHSLIIDPWGKILADGGDDSGVITAEIDLANVKKARQMIPALQHDRAYILEDANSVKMENVA